MPRYPLGRPKQSFHLPHFSQSLRYYLPAYLPPTYLPPTYLPSTPLRPLYLPSSGFHALPLGFRNLWAPSTSFDRQRLLRKQQELALGREKQGHEEGVIYKGSRGYRGGGLVRGEGGG